MGVCSMNKKDKPNNFHKKDNLPSNNSNADKLSKGKKDKKEDAKMELTKDCVDIQESEKDVSVEEMKKHLKLDSIEPIVTNSTDGQDKQEKGDCFDEWYAEELKEIYKRCK